MINLSGRVLGTSSPGTSRGSSCPFHARLRGKWNTGIAWKSRGARVSISPRFIPASVRVLAAVVVVEQVERLKVMASGFVVDEPE